MKRLQLILLAVVYAIGVWAEPQNGVVYVKAGASGTGASWSDALGDIQAAIGKAREDSEKRKDVWVSGSFTLTANISMQDSVNVYGSFAGTETALEERAKIANGKAWEFVNPSVLTGNSCRLVQVAANFDIPTIFDGFVLTNGNGVGSATSGNGGGAVLRQNAVLQNCIVKNCEVTNGAGGGVMINGGGAVRYCLIKDNVQTTNANGGGGIFCNTSSMGFEAFIENCEVTSNKSDIRGAGVGIQGQSNVYVRNCMIYNNIAIKGVALLQGAGIFANSATNEIINNLVFNNTGSNSIQLQTKKFANNTVVKNIGGIYIATGTNVSEIKNNIVWACTTDATGTTATSISGVAVSGMPVQNNATYNQLPEDKGWDLAENILFSSNVSNGDIEEPKEGTIGSGPKFAKVSSFIGAIDAAAISPEDYATLYQELLDADWSLNSNSPCVNAGQNLAYVTSDIIGGNRPQGFPFETAKTDIGAYELPYYVVAFATYDTSKGSIYDESGTAQTSNNQLGFAKGAEFMLYFLSQSGDKPFKVTAVRSNNGGLTFDGEESDVTSELDDDGLWTSRAYFPFQIRVQWTADDNAVSSAGIDKIRCIDTGKSVRIEKLPLGSELYIYHASGTLAYRANVSNGTASVSLPSGVYIIHAAGFAQKIVVK